MHMKKIIVSVILILVLGISFFFYFGFHTYFIEKKVSEDAPEIMANMDQATDTQEIQQKQKIRAGSFVEVDAIHKGSGDARILSASDGTHILRFEENFKVTNGPDLYVYLSNTEQPASTERSLGEYVNLGLLKGNVGSQNYVIPEGYEDYKTAVIWCKKYGVLFTYAMLK